MGSAGRRQRPTLMHFTQWHTIQCVSVCVSNLCKMAASARAPCKLGFSPFCCNVLSHFGGSPVLGLFLCNTRPLGSPQMPSCSAKQPRSSVLHIWYNGGSSCFKQKSSSSASFPAVRRRRRPPSPTGAYGRLFTPAARRRSSSCQPGALAHRDLEELSARLLLTHLASRGVGRGIRSQVRVDERGGRVPMEFDRSLPLIVRWWWWWGSRGADMMLSPFFSLCGEMPLWHTASSRDQGVGISPDRGFGRPEEQRFQRPGWHLSTHH